MLLSLTGPLGLLLDFFPLPPLKNTTTLSFCKIQTWARLKKPAIDKDKASIKEVIGVDAQSFSAF